MIRCQAWIALILLLVTPASPQQTSNIHITVQVVDQTGANVPKAQLEVSTSEGGALMSTEADVNGKADFELPIGSFDLVIESQGFCPQKRSLKVLGQPIRPITAELKLDACPGPCQAFCITVLGAAPPTPSSSPPGLKAVVEDQSGVRIPLTVIEVWTEKNTLMFSMFTNKWGEATLPLVPGRYRLSASARGFKTSSQVVDYTTDADQSIRVVLAVANQCAGCLSVEREEEIEFERAVPEASIAPEPLQRLFLPGHKLRMRERHRHTGLAHR